MMGNKGGGGLKYKSVLKLTMDPVSKMKLCVLVVVHIFMPGYIQEGERMTGN